MSIFNHRLGDRLVDGLRNECRSDAFNQKPSGMSRFSGKFCVGTTEHTDDMDEKEIPHQVLMKCDATLYCFWGWRKAAEDAQNAKCLVSAAKNGHVLECGGAPPL
jgi:hypothetical protein